MIVLALNCGSSSLKCELIDVPDHGAGAETCIARAAVERIGPEASIDVAFEGEETSRRNEPVADHAAAVERLIAALRLLDHGRALAVGHRVVHGGARFIEPTRIDRDVRREIASLSGIAPLHNEPALAAIDAAATLLSDVPAVAVFDTAFHARLPARAAECAIPVEVAQRHGIRRFGFHGLAHRSMCERFAQANAVERTHKLVTLQLGHGVSAAAIDDGRSIDVSMGFSPLEGLMMSSRSGDLDPALVAHLARCTNASADDVVSMLNTRAGLLGVSGRSADMRQLLVAAEHGDVRSSLAVEMFVYRVQKCVGAYLAALQGADAIVFGGGIGERSPEIRARVCRGLAWCGLELDDDANARCKGNGRISRHGAALEAWVISVDEQRLIARDTVRCLRAP